MRSIMMQIAEKWTTIRGTKMQQMLSNTMEKMVLIVTTFSTMDDADAAISHLLERRLIACGSAMPGMTSTYRWNGGVERSTEVHVVLKTLHSLTEAASQALAEVHPYEIPEIVCIDVGHAHAPYLAWVADACRSTT